MTSPAPRQDGEGARTAALISAPVPPCWHCGYAQRPLQVEISAAAVAALARPEAQEAQT